MVTLSVITIIMPKMEKPYFTGGSVKKNGTRETGAQNKT